ncbi:HET-domain-containing protein [Venturia nashicola]|uniref:HET-domain-containing protein n=1 Tax=Venturia nashicola TaxID=86259 RepID=A0A4Z1PF35_9PEZI|nr:HET-domain-containing protein [Venturia nashicola]TLD31893.1 HET-domain-containing protein [Venturia nashicola]
MFDRPFSDYVYFHEGATTGTEPVPLTFGTVCEVKQTTDCPLCCLVWKSFLLYNDGSEPPEQVDGKRISITVESVACGLYGPVYTYDRSGPDPEASANRLHFTLSPWLWRSYDNKKSAFPDWLAVIQQIDRSQASIPSSLCSGRHIGKQGTEVSVVQRWLQICQEQHVSCGIKRPYFEYPSRLIDVRRQCLVRKKDIPGQPDYAILSYVWGRNRFVTLNSNTSETLHEPGTISPDNSDIPATIRDTIHLCQSLNQKYLWVDALCIKQDGLEDKMKEIGRMDDIYGGAALTIVATTGNHANAGLPGVGQTTRTNTQHILEMDGLVLANRLPSAQKLVDESVWNSRAWTYQERLLSRRILFLTDRQTFFTCLQMQCCEDTVTEYSVSHPEPGFETVSSIDDEKDEYLQFHTAISPLEYPHDDMTELQKYAHHVTEYSRRSLSFESDVLNAFQGVMRQLSSRVLESETQYNLPLRLIDIAILWTPLGPLRKRSTACDEESLPSWAWAWWVGPVEYAEKPNLAERTLSQRMEQFSDFPCKMPPSQAAHWVRTISRPISVDFRRQIVEGEITYSSRCTPGLLCRPASDYHRQAFESLPLKGLLTLRTSVADFSVSMRHVADKDHHFNTPPCTADNHRVCHLLITDSHGAKAGCVIIDGNTADSLAPGTFSFVKLSRTTNLHDEDDSAWDAEVEAFIGVPGEPAINPDFGRSRSELWFDQDVFDSSVCWCLYNVLMVRWREDGAGIRLGIGKIHTHAFDAAAGDEMSVSLG